MTGETVSHYKILEKVGEGGMGVVYKALDLKLDRVVALKFLPHRITPDEAEQARFLQEAKAASALNHPNVCTIHGIHDDEEPKFIEMEFVEGTTLRHKHPVPSLAEAIGYAVQIGDALHEAHQKGIVHRDIKADNIMINTKNQVKVMDFGLAKLKGSVKLTRATSTVGTLAYMAPEQIQGGNVDARSDIFSYGVLLYEMLTGRMPFRTEHEAALMYSIINDEPEPMQKYRADLSPVLMNLVQRALEKDPNDRYQSINEMVIELRRMQKQSSKVSRTTLTSIPVQSTPADREVDSGPTAAVPAQKIRSRGLIIGISGGALAIALIALWMFVFRTPAQIGLNPAMTFRTLQIPFHETGYPGISRDGGWAAFAGNVDGSSWDIYLMNTSSGEPRRITNDSAGFMGNADLSPDGSQIVYDRSDKAYTKPEIAVVSSLGGFSKRIVNIGFNPRWRPDGQRVAYVLPPFLANKSGKSEFRSVKSNGSDDRLEFTDSLDISWFFAWSPDGKEICWTRRVADGHFEMFARNLETGSERRITSHKTSAMSLTWTQDDQIIYSGESNGNRNLWIVAASGGTPLQITRGSGPDVAPASSADGKRLMYIQEQSLAKIWLASLQGNDARQITFDEVDISDPVFSPDGSKILYVLSTPGPKGGVSSLMLMDLKSGQKSQLLSEETNIHSPKWSPDGKWVAYGAHPDSIDHYSAAAYVLDAESQGSARKVGIGLPDNWLDNESFTSNTGAGTRTCTIDGAPPKIFFRDSTWAQLLVNGKYIVHSDVVMGRDPGVYIEPVASAGTSSVRPKLLIKSAVNLVYEPASKSLYYFSAQNEFRRILLPEGRDEIVKAKYPNLRRDAAFSFSRDGKFITYLDQKSVRKMMLIDNLR